MDVRLMREGADLDARVDDTTTPDIDDRLATIEFPDKPEGPIAAAVIAGGIGAAALGAFTTLAEAGEDLKEWLDFESDV